MEIEQLNAIVHRNRADVEVQEQSLAQSRERHSEVELEHEKTIQRIERLQDQIHLLEERKTALAEEKAQALDGLTRTLAEQETRTVQLAELEQTRQGLEKSLDRTKSALTEVTEQSSREQQAIEQLRKEQFEIVGSEARIRNEISSRRETINRIAAQVQRLEREENEARAQAAGLERQLNAARDEYSGQRAGFTHLRVRLQESEETLARYRGEHSEGVKAAADARAREEAIRHRLQTIGELAVHRAYSTESVKRFFNHTRSTNWAPLGILADFMEVEHDYEAVIEDYLRNELQYVVVEDRAGAERALGIVKDVTKGRLECIVLTGATASGEAEQIEGAVPLTALVRFDERVKHFSNYLRNA